MMRECDKTIAAWREDVKKVAIAFWKTCADADEIEYRRIMSQPPIKHWTMSQKVPPDGGCDMPYL